MMLKELFKLFKKKQRINRYVIKAELIKGGVSTIKVFSPLAKSKARAVKSIMLRAERQGYEGIRR